MRTMETTDKKIKLNIVEHIITRNMWEYYITDKKIDADTRLAYVMGFENELGYVSLDEIRPYILTRTTKLDEVMPAIGYQWGE